MVTQKQPPRPIYLREWRKFMGTKVPALARALQIERESYYRLERETWRLSLPQIETIADVNGIVPSQLWFKPPVPGVDRDVSLDHLLVGAPDEVQAMAVKAIRGMVGK